MNQTDAEHGATVKRSGRGFVRARDYYRKGRETMNGFERLAGQRAGIHHEYSREAFERCFGKSFRTFAVEPVTERGRTLYLMRRRGE